MTVTDVPTLVATATLLVSLLIRVRPKASPTYAPLLWTQLSIIVVLAMSLSWIYPVLDAGLGGRNYLNLISHLIFLGASWTYTIVLAEPFYRGRDRPVTLRGWVPVVAAIGATVSFVLLDPKVTSRGLEAFTDEPAWIGYWVFNVMTLWVPALTLVPRLFDAVKYTTRKALVTAYWAMIVGYSTSVLVMLGYIVTYFAPDLIVVRELLVLITELGLIVALISIPVSSHQQSAERSARHQAESKAAARFHY